MKKVLAIILAATFLSFIANPVWSAGTLKVTTPNGDQKWATGKKYTIKWSKGNAGAYVKIQLLKSGKAYKTIKAKTKNDGKYRWKIPSSVKTGSAYKIKVISVSKQTVRDLSNKNFTITKASSTTTLNNGVPTPFENWRFRYIYHTRRWITLLQVLVIPAWFRQTRQNLLENL